MDTMLRINLNANALTKAASILSNTVLLGANTYLIVNSLKSSIAEKNRNRVVETLQLTAEVASAVAGLTKVVTDKIDQYHANREDL